MPIYLACRRALRIYDIITCTRLHNYCVRSALPVAMEIHTQKIAIAIKKDKHAKHGVTLMITSQRLHSVLAPDVTIMQIFYAYGYNGVRYRVQEPVL